MRHISATVLSALVLMVGCLAPTATFAAWCNDKSNITEPMNLNPVDRSEPVFVRSVPNGELYTVGTGGQDEISLVHLYGNNGYDWGYAMGSLMPSELKDVMTTAKAYFDGQIEGYLNRTITKLKWKIPQYILDMIAQIGMDAVLDLQNAECKPFTDPQIYDEIRGLSDASGVSFNDIVRIHMIGEVTKGDCSFYGAYGAATLGGKTLQLRALDWDTGAGLQNHPVVVIYHPGNQSGLGHEFANIGWAGWVGVLTGMSKQQLGISEIGIAYPDKTFGDESFIGIPFVFLEREIVQRARDIWDAMYRISAANRTCDLVLGVADARANTSRLVQYSHSIVRFFNDRDLEPNYWWHPRLQDVVYCGMDWMCPFYQHLLHNQLKQLHGQLTPELSIMNVTAPVGTGSLHTAVYDLTDMILFVANARGRGETGPKDAYARQFVRIDIGKAFGKIYGEGR